MKGKKRLKILMVDDEALARLNLRMLLVKDPDVEIIEECSNGNDAIEAIRTGTPDIVFLDIQMPRLNGFKVLDGISQDCRPIFVFVTAYERYAMKAFEVDASDYLLKPVTDQRFAAALARAKSQLEQRELADMSRQIFALVSAGREPSSNGELADSVPTAFTIRTAQRLFRLKASEIDWIEAVDYYSSFHVGSASYLVRETMSDLEVKLASEDFLRIHRSTIVNLKRLQQVRICARDYWVVLQDGTQLKMSRRRHKQIEMLLKRPVRLASV